MLTKLTSAGVRAVLVAIVVATPSLLLPSVSGDTSQIVVLIGLACFTTAVGIITGAADFLQSRFGGSRAVYKLTALTGCLLGVLIGQLPVDYIIAVALPALMFIYPLTSVLILLNVLPTAWTPPLLFRAVVVTTLLFSIPDFLGSIGVGGPAAWMEGWWPLQAFQLGWVLPSVLVFLAYHILGKPLRRS